jgi:hypothetical protein
MLTVVDGDPEPPRDPAHLELLGLPCSACQRLHGIDQARRQVRDEASAATAAGLPPAKRCTACDGWHRWEPAALTASPASPRAPTGVMWPAGAGQPPEVTAALTAATRPRRRSINASKATGKYRLIEPRRVPPPPYYRAG